MRKKLLGTFSVLAFTLAPSLSFGWGREGQHVIVILAEHYMHPETAVRVHELLGSESLEDAAA